MNNANFNFNKTLYSDSKLSNKSLKKFCNEITSKNINKFKSLFITYPL